MQSKPANGDYSDIAFDATLRAAAPYQVQREEQRKTMAFALRKTDLQKKIRVRKAANLVMFAVDASWSMAVAERMKATKGAIMSLLTDAYQRRDRVGLVVFQKNKSTLVLPPTNSVQLARRALADIPVGGKTPLSAGLTQSYEVIKKHSILYPDVQPLMILLTDGAGNVSMTNMSPAQETKIAAQKFAQDRIRSIVINMEHVLFDQGLAKQLAEHMDAPCLSLANLKAESLYETVKQGLGDL